jgi:hypothetical protein
MNASLAMILFAFFTSAHALSITHDLDSPWCIMGYCRTYSISTQYKELKITSQPTYSTAPTWWVMTPFATDDKSKLSRSKFPTTSSTIDLDGVSKTSACLPMNETHAFPCWITLMLTFPPKTEYANIHVNMSEWGIEAIYTGKEMLGAEQEERSKMHDAFGLSVFNDVDADGAMNINDLQVRIRKGSDSIMTTHYLKWGCPTRTILQPFSRDFPMISDVAFSVPQLPEYFIPAIARSCVVTLVVTSLNHKEMRALQIYPLGNGEYLTATEKSAGRPIRWLLIGAILIGILAVLFMIYRYRLRKNQQKMEGEVYLVNHATAQVASA